MQRSGTEPKRTFRDLAEGRVKGDDYEPQVLFIIPIYLRSRRQYYDEAIKGVRQEIEDIWEWQGDLYESREAFENSSVVNWIWDSRTPPWWGLSDIVGYIDVRMDVLAQEIQAALFLPTKRVSRQLKKKVFCFHRREAIFLVERGTNQKLRAEVRQLIEELRRDERVRNRYVDLDPYWRILDHIDLVDLIRSTAAAVIARHDHTATGAEGQPPAE